MPRRYPKYRDIFLTALIAGIALIFYFHPSFLTNIRNLALDVITAPSSFCGGVTKYFRTKGMLLDENRKLRKNVADLSLAITRLADIKEENGRLRKLLDFSKKFEFETVPAEVIAREPDNWTESFVINKGTKDGVRGQMAVCSARGLLGKIAETAPNTSLVVPLTHPNFRTGGVILGTRVNGVILGTGKDEIEMLYLPLDADIGEGAVVMTSGLSRTLPEGILIGKVVSVEKDKSGLYLNARVEPYARLFDAEEVLCVVER